MTEVVASEAFHDVHHPLMLRVKELDALAARLRRGRPIRNDEDDPVAQMELVDRCYVAAGLPVRPPHARPERPG